MANQLKKQTKTSKAIGYAIGTLQGLLFVEDLTENQKEIIKKAIEGLLEI